MTKAELIDEIENRIGFDTDNETYAMSKDERDFYTSILEILEQEPCDDAVSRQAVIGIIKRNCIPLPNTIKHLEDLPPVTPKREQGEWIDCQDEGYVECPICGSATNCDDNKEDLHYCFSCGAEMR